MQCPLTGDSDREFLTKDGGYDWYRFSGSGILQVDLESNPDAAAQESKPRAQNYVASYEKKWASKLRRSRRRAKFLAARMAGKRILDVGSNVGLFCAAAKGIGLEPVGLEIDGALVDYARGRFPELSFDATPIEDYEPSEPFDAVYCSEVIEHTGDAMTFARHLRRMLGDGGLLYLTTPAASEYVRGRDTVLRPMGAPDHKIYLDHGNIAPFLRAAGFAKVAALPSFKPRLRGGYPSWRAGLKVLAWR